MFLFRDWCVYLCSFTITDVYNSFLTIKNLTMNIWIKSKRSLYQLVNGFTLQRNQTTDRQTYSRCARKSTYGERKITMLRCKHFIEENHSTKMTNLLHSSWKTRVSIDKAFSANQLSLKFDLLGVGLITSIYLFHGDGNVCSKLKNIRIAFDSTVSVCW